MSAHRGKNVAITGGSSGIGLAIGEAFAAAGANVLLLAQDAGRLESAVDRVRAVRADEEQRIEARQLDVSVRQAVQDRFAEVQQSFGAVDVLVNSAGVFLARHFDSIAPEEFERTIQVNLLGTWYTVSAVARGMKARGAGHIVNVSSIAGLVGIFGYADYSAAKFGVAGLSEVLRAELRPHGVAVSLLCPPDTDTPGLANENRDKPVETRWLSRHASVLTPERVAQSLLRGMTRRRYLIVPGLDGWLFCRMCQICPGLIRWLMDREIRKARAR